MLLDEKAIRKHLQTTVFNESLDLHIFASIDSTNRYLREFQGAKLNVFPSIARNLQQISLAPSSGDSSLCSERRSAEPIIVCCAEEQTQGRGRLQRSWYSPPNENIYCSIRWQLPKNTAELPTLSLVMSLAVLQCLQSLNIADSTQIKWPNDLLWQEKKLCGILIETSQADNQNLNVIVGIGLNVNSNPEHHSLDKTAYKPWCSLYQITQRHLDRNELIAHILFHTNHYFQLFKNEGFNPFLSLWQRSDYLLGKQVSIAQMNATVQGRVQGISAQGQLIVEVGKESIKIACGEASVIREE